MKCVHWTVFEPPQGPTSRGVCKLCGAVTLGRNSYEIASVWARDSKPDSRTKHMQAPSTYKVRHPRKTSTDVAVATTQAAALAGAATMGKLTNGWVRPRGGAE